MQTLPTQLKHSGYNLTQVDRGPQWAIYRKAHPGYHNDHYEVVAIQVMPAATMPSGSQLPEREIYPNSEAWGEMGWTCQTLERARAIAELLEQDKTGDAIRSELHRLRKTG